LPYSTRLLIVFHISNRTEIYTADQNPFTPTHAPAHPLNIHQSINNTMTSSTAAYTSTNFRTINIDALDPESSANFDLTSLTPGVQPVSAAEVQQLTGQIRQLLRGGDSEGALRGALVGAPYGGDARSKVSLGW